MKRMILLLTAVLMLLALGCGKTQEQPKQDDPNAVYIDPNAPQDEQNEGGVDLSTVRGGEYGNLYFEANGVRFGIYDEAQPVLDKLPKETGAYTRESCAFDHEDVFHLYTSFEIMTNEIDGVARITAIRVTSDLIETPQGLKIGMSEEDAVKALPALADADWNLADGTALLSVTVVDGKVAEIVYTPVIGEN